ncbi:MAG: type I secretion system permease/ATPase [Campylobacteraceae bacterium]|nr:type I secretion system permease/ATPase [Campylobacteraceae bacterium]
MKTSQSSLLNSLVLYTKIFSKPYSADALIHGLPIETSSAELELFSISDSKSIFSRAAFRAGLETTLIKRDIAQMLSLQLPIILILSKNNSCILEQFSDDRQKVKIIYSEGNGTQEWINTDLLENEYLGYAFLVKKKFVYSEKSSKTLKMEQKHWFWSTLKMSTSIYKDILVASLLINLFVLATPLFTMNVYDRVIPNTAIETLLVFTIGIVIVYVLDLFLKLTRSYLLEIAAKKSDIIMSSIIFEKIIDLNLSEHPNSVGSFANNIKNFESVRSFFTTATMSAIIDLPFTIIFLCLIYYIAGNIVFVPILTIFLILFYALLIKKPIRETIEKSHEASAAKNGILIESLQNIETIKTMKMAGKIQWKWEELTGEIAKVNLKSKILSSSIPTITNFFIQLNTVFVVVFGVFMIQEFELTMGGLIAAVILTSRTVAPMGQVAGLITTYEDARTSFEVINKIISKPAEKDNHQDFIEMRKIKGKIEFKNVTFKYPNSDILALDDVSFIIEEGEKVAIIGRIGSGKSTIAKLILKLYSVDKGTILIDGIDITQINSSDIRGNISYVPQEISLFNGTLKDNIISSEQHPSPEDIERASFLSGTKEFVDSHPRGYEMRIGEKGLGLSGGQKQSVGIARALLVNSKIMLMDEPSNAMDQTSEKNLLKNLESEISSKTLILVTQKLNLLSLVDRVIVMHHSKLISDDKKEKILSKKDINDEK